MPNDVPKLIGGPYLAPATKRGDWIDDEVLGLTEVGGWTDAPIPWPRRKKTGRPSLILTSELARAVCTESVDAICHHWGVRPTKVWQWRQALGVERITDGTRCLLQERTGVPPDAAARGREKAGTPECRAKMRDSKRGVTAHENTKTALLKAAKAPKPLDWGARANAWMLGHDAPDPPADRDYLKRRWTDREDAKLKRFYLELSAEDLASQLGRTPAAVRKRLNYLGLHKHRTWSDHDETFLKTEYPHNSTKWIAEQLERSEVAIHIRAHKLGLPS